jgi:hypothetical protein
MYMVLFLCFPDSITHTYRLCLESRGLSRGLPIWRPVGAYLILALLGLRWTGGCSRDS